MLSYGDVLSWLEKRGCIEQHEKEMLSHADTTRRARALQTVKFGPAVDYQRQCSFLQRLTPLSHMLAVEQTDLGLITDPRFTYKLALEDYTPIRDKPIIYPPHVEAWLDEQLDQMLATGRIVPVPPDVEPPMTTALVLVPEGQTG